MDVNPRSYAAHARRPKQNLGSKKSFVGWIFEQSQEKMRYQHDRQL